MVMEFNSTKNHAPIRKLIHVLGQDFARSKDNNKRKGGLLGLAATSIGLGKVCSKAFNIKTQNYFMFMFYLGYGKIRKGIGESGVKLSVGSRSAGSIVCQ